MTQIQKIHYDIFLSHNSEDKDAVIHLAQKLREANFEPFLDTWHLVPGEPWQEAIEDALAQSATCAVFVGPTGVSPWQNEEMRSALDSRVRDHDLRVIPVLLPHADMPKRGDLPTFLSRLTWVDFRHDIDNGIDNDEAFYHLTCGIKGIAPGPVEREQPSTTDVIPYRGLQVFEEEHARFFFGRTALIQQLVEHLRTNRFLGVIGASGSGKSSVVRAGLIPELRKGVLAGSDEWAICIMTPGSHPLDELATKVTPILSGGADIDYALSLQKQLRSDGRALHTAIRLAFDSGSVHKRLFLFIDQFEELFTLVRDDDEGEKERQKFLDNILYATNIAQGRTIVVLTMRADFYSHTAAYSELADRLAAYQAPVTEMQVAELQEAIESPAQLVRLQFDAGLVETLIEDVQHEPGALPLLQHALLELYERRKGNRLTFDAYQEIGGIQGAIAHRAEAIFADFSPEQQDITRQIMMRLTQPGQETEDTRRRASKAELVRDDQQAALVDEVVKTLADARLLTTSLFKLSPPDESVSAEEPQSTNTPQDIIDVSHEALIRGWPRLQAWVNEDRSSFLVHRRLTEAALEWAQNDHSKDYLYRGDRLAEIERWRDQLQAEMNPLEHRFVDACIELRTEEADRERQQQQERVEAAERLAQEQTRRVEEAQASNRRLNRRALYLVAALVLAIGAGIAAFSFYQNALEQAAIADEQRIEAEDQAKIAEDNADEAEKQTAIAREKEQEANKQRTEAERSTRGIVARQITSQAGLYRDNDEELALLLAMEAVSKTQTIDQYVTLEANTALRGLLHPAYRMMTEILGGHMSDVWSVEFSTDGTRIVSASDDKTVRIWDADSAEQLVRLDGHTSSVNSVGFSPDGTRIVSGSSDQTVRIWDADSGEQLKQMDGHTYRVNSVGFSPGGTRIVSASDDKTVRIWNADSGEQLTQMDGHTYRVNSVGFSPDGTRIVSASDDRTVRIWDADSGEQLMKMDGHTSSVNSARFSPDGTRIVSAGGLKSRGSITLIGDDLTVYIWDAETGEQLAQLDGHAAGVRSVGFGPNGTRIISASEDQTVRIWDATSGEQLALFDGHTSSVYSVGFSPDATRIVSASGSELIDPEPTVQIWDVETGEQLAQLGGHTSSVNSIGFNPDGTHIVSASDDKTVRIWDADSGEQLAQLDGHTFSVNSVGFNPDGTRIVSAGGSNFERSDKTVRIWDPETGEQLVKMDGHTSSVNSVGFNPNGTHIVSASDDKTVRIWDADSGEQLAQLDGHTSSVYSVGFNPDGTHIVSASSDQSVRIWDPETGEQLMKMDGHTSSVYSVGFSPDGTRIVSASRDKTIRIWDADSGEQLALLDGHTSSVYSVGFSPDGTRIVSGSADKTVRIWDADSGEQLAQLDGHAAGIRSVGFGPNGTRIISASEDQTMRIWKEVNPDQTLLVGHHSGVWNVGVDDTGTWVASAGQSGIGRLENLANVGQTIELIGHGVYSGLTPISPSTRCDQCIQQIRFSPTGEAVITGGWDGTVRLWSVADESSLWVEQFENQVASAIFDQTGRYIAASDIKGNLKLWSASTGAPQLQKQGYNVVAFSPDGDLLSGESIDVGIKIWNTATGNEFLEFTTEDSLTDVAFDPTGQYLIGVGFDHIGYIWDVHAKELIHTLRGHTGIIWRVMYNQDGSLIATASEDHTARLWDAKTGEELLVLHGHDGPVQTLAFRADGRQLATGSHDGTVRLWSTLTGSVEAILPDSRGTEILIDWEYRIDGRVDSNVGWVMDVAYTPDGSHIIAGALDGSVTMYVASTEKLMEIARSQVSRQLTCEERVRYLFEQRDCEVEAATTAP